MGKPAGIRSALIIHSGALGDTLLMFAFARAVRLAGIARVAIMTRGAYLPLARHCSFIDECHDMDTHRIHALFSPEASLPDRTVELLRRNELIVDMLGDASRAHANQLKVGVHRWISIDPRPRETSDHIVTQWLEDFQCETALRADLYETVSTGPLLTLPAPLLDEARQRWASLRSEAGRKKPWVLIHPGSGSREKCWPLDHFIPLAHRLAKDGWCAAFLIGPVECERFNPEERQRLKAAAPLFTAVEPVNVAALALAADCAVTNDSGIAHLAGAAGARVVALFGPTDPGKWRPIGSNVSILHEPPGWPTVDAVHAAIGPSEFDPNRSSAR